MKLFGTDGIRGTANRHPMTSDIVLRVGQALGHLLRQNTAHLGGAPKVVIGKDTRLSGYMVEMALASGLNSMGINVELVGPLPTPGIGFLTRNMRADAGIVISASHNPFEDNGIKIFGADGFKISSDWEQAIEKMVADNKFEELLAPSSGIGRSRRIDDAAGRYIVFVKNTFPEHLSLDGLRIVLDCANGAAYKVAPLIFEELGAEVVVLNNRPNGTNINLKAGALYPNYAVEGVRQYRADVGISLDGDADRVIMIDEKGNHLNGDNILAVCAIDLKSKSRLQKNTIVTTEMANFGLDKLMSKNGIKIVKTNVGDKYVVEEMKKNQYILGGESSGHLIFLEHATTGDGLVAALAVLAVMREKKCKLSELKDVLITVPQVLKNIRVTRRMALDQVPGYSKLIGEINTKLQGEGRTFVRFSGTEPLVRVMVEGPDEGKIDQFADQIAKLLAKELT